MKLKLTSKNLAKDEMAISPVVATLMLILVAVGGAVGVSVFMGAFQDKAESNTSADVAGDCLKIGGSTTVHPVNEQMAALYEAAYPGTCTELSQGGSGAGLRGVGIGTLDIGARSDPVNLAATTYPDFNQDGVRDPGAELKVTTIGYDAVAMVTQATNCLYADATLRNIGLTSAIVADLYALKMGVAGYTNQAFTGLATPVTWEQLAEEVQSGDHTATGTTTCNGVGAIKLTDRADLGGTSEFACQKLLGRSATDTVICSEAGQIPANAGILQGTGNAGVEALFTDNLVLGFSSWGTAVNVGNLEAFPHGGVAPTGGATGTIKTATFPGARHLIYVTVGEPDGANAHFIDFVRDLQRNDVVLNSIGYLSLQDVLGSV